MSEEQKKGISPKKKLIFLRVFFIAAIAVGIASFIGTFIGLFVDDPLYVGILLPLASMSGVAACVLVNFYSVQKIKCYIKQQSQLIEQLTFQNQLFVFNLIDAILSKDSTYFQLSDRNIGLVILDKKNCALSTYENKVIETDLYVKQQMEVKLGAYTSYDMRLHLDKYVAVYELIDIFVPELIGRINAKCEDKKYSNIITYYVIRNNIIKYFHDKYIEQENYAKNLKELLDKNPSSDLSFFTYYYLYENDKFASIIDTYSQLKNKQAQLVETNKHKEILGELFEHSTPETDINASISDD